MPLPPPSKTINSPVPGTTYAPRFAVRVVAFNPAGQVAMIHARRDNYYKLPGGGVEAGEDHMMEETGCTVRIRGGGSGSGAGAGAGAGAEVEESGGEADAGSETGCIAAVEEWRAPWHQTSYCYVADLETTGAETSLAEDEIADGLSAEWMDVGRAKEAIREAVPTSGLGRSIRERDMFLLDVATALEQSR